MPTASAAARKHRRPHAALLTNPHASSSTSSLILSSPKKYPVALPAAARPPAETNGVGRQARGGAGGATARQQRVGFAASSAASGSDCDMNDGTTTAPPPPAAADTGSRLMKRHAAPLRMNRPAPRRASMAASKLLSTIFSPGFNFFGKLSNEITQRLLPDEGDADTTVDDVEELESMTDDAGSQGSCAMDVDTDSAPTVPPNMADDTPSTMTALGHATKMRYAAPVSLDSTYDSDDDNYGLDPYDPLLLLVVPPPVPAEFRRRPYALPRKTRSSPPITLVLDLDETLVHCTTTPMPDTSYAINFHVRFQGVDYNVVGNFRPHCREFLQAVSQQFEVVVFTASQKAYADRLLNMLDPERKWIKYRLFRDSCVFAGGNYLKDLTILGRDLANVVIVDNAPQAFAYQILNGVPIESWYDDLHDRELVNVHAFLQTLIGLDDVRPAVDRAFRWRERVQHMF